MSLFGPSQKEIWTKLSSEINAKFVDGGVWKQDRIVVQEKVWTITLDTFAAHTGKATIPFTRFRAPFMSKDNFRFEITRRNFFSPVADFFGRKSLSTGHPDFDKQFVIASADEYKMRKLMANETIRELIAGQKDVHFEIKDDEGWLATQFPQDADELYFQMSGVVKDATVLKKGFQLMAETLNQLVEISSAYEREVNIVLK